MNRQSQTLSAPNVRHQAGWLLVALICVAALFGCSDDVTEITNVNPSATSLNVNVNPASAAVVVTGPDSFTQSFTGNQLLSGLTPGIYTVAATAPGFIDGSGQINVISGQTSNLSLFLTPTSIITDAPRAVYRDDQGNLIPFDPTTVQLSDFVFYAWLQDIPNGGIAPENLTATPVSDPLEPLTSEQTESAPSLSQNLAGAWVGYRDANGIVRPVIGADVRWEIDQTYPDRVNSTQFGTSDDNGMATGYGIFDDQANTRTNNAELLVENFPLAVTQYPLYNRTGVNTPLVDGFTWVTLFSPDITANARIVAVATINGNEVGKQILLKQFAPAPRLEITKTVNTDIVNLAAGTATATWTVTVKNTGLGDATTINLSDILASGNGAAYTLSGLPAGSTPVGDGFTLAFPLAAGGTETLSFLATVTAPGTYCNEAQITSYSDGVNTTTPLNLKDDACFTALESNVSIVKDFVAADNTTSLGKALTVAANEPAKLRVRVINNGTGDATGVVISDVLTSGTLANYTASAFSSGTPNSSGGFDATVATLPFTAPGNTVTYIYTVAASVDGTYCDTATVTAATGIIGIGTDSACLTVATANLAITKDDAPANVMPGATYTSTIVVTNNGSATARNVVISDLLGLNAANNVEAIYVSSSLNDVSGTLTNSVVTAPTVEIPAGENMTFTVVSRIPPGASSGTYCDTATVTSSNATTMEATDCIDVPAFSALQTQLIDINDPVAAGSNVTYSSTLYVEDLSNDGVRSNVLRYSFGLDSPVNIGDPGSFQVVSTNVYLDTNPIRDPVTGNIVSDSSSPTAVLQTLGTDYTVDNSVAGLQILTMTPGVVLQPNTALYVVHEALVPTGTPTALYTTSYIWTSVGAISASPYEASSSEATTVLP